ncbi:hypothetical protein [Breoghania sp. L-A4]|nr:hypothetical protein [Breoghania sp. L-A4]
MSCRFRIPVLLMNPGRDNLPGLFWAIAFLCLVATTLIIGPAVALSL